MSRKAHGQYFTLSTVLQKLVYDYVQNKGHTLLEPSFGAGHLLRPFLAEDPNYPMVCCELNRVDEPVVVFGGAQRQVYGDFLSQTDLGGPFMTIVGNPPYVTRRGLSNLYLAFIERCVSLLAEGGELIFIVPSNFVKLTSAQGLVKTMHEGGTFTHITTPHDEKMFEGASVDILVFRYVKSDMCHRTSYNGRDVEARLVRGILTLTDRLSSGVCLEDLYTVYVGMVSGCDSVFRSQLGHLSLLVKKDTVETYIYTEEFPTGDAAVDAYLEAHKPRLMSRKIRPMTEESWFKWGAMRNKARVDACIGRPCAYLNMLTRTSSPAFLGTVQYFGGQLLCIVPRTEEALIRLCDLVAFLNSDVFRKEHTYAGRFKAGQREVANCALPATFAQCPTTQMCSYYPSSA